MSEAIVREGTPAPIVIVNGTSSSGKTSVVRAVQDLSPEPFLDMGLDRFLFALPKRYLDRPHWDDVLGRNVRAGDVGMRVFSAMHHAIAALSRQGMPVVADHVLVERAWVDSAAAAFAGLPAYLVALRCPLHVLEQRERDRADRTLGQAREQFDVVHSHVARYDLELDSSELSPTECAQRILALLADPPSAAGFAGRTAA